MTRKTYWFQPLPVAVETSDPQLGARVDYVLGTLFKTEPTGAPGPELTLRFHTNDSDLNRETSRHAEAEVFNAGGLVVSRTAAGYRLERGSSWQDLKLSSGAGEGVLDEGFWTNNLREQREFFLLGLMMLMHRQRLYGIHANGLVNGTGVLVAGRSGSGKTTLSLAMVAQGWSYVSDDAVTLDGADGSVEALALTRGFSCTPEAATHFPDLADALAEAPLVDDEKRLVDLEQVYPGQSADRCGPGVILFPTIGDRRRTELVPISRTECLVNLVQHSAGIMTDARASADQLRTLNTLAHQAAGYEVLLGRDVYEDPSAVASVLTNAEKV